MKEVSEKVGLKLDIQKTKVMASSPITSWQINGKTIKMVRDFIILALKSLHMVTSAMKLRRLLIGRKAMTNLDAILKKQIHYFTNKGPSNQSYGFSSSHLWMWELEYKESWVLKLWYWKDAWESLGLKGDQTSPS